MEKKNELHVLTDTGKPAGGSRNSGMSRRQLAQLLLSGAGVAAGVPALAQTHPVHKHLASETTFAKADAKTKAAAWKPEFLSPHQNETLVVLAERIVPGSTRAAVNRFLDLLLSVETRETQQRFINSLSAFDGVAVARFNRPFKAITEAQQNELLTEASTAKPGTPGPQRDEAAPAGESRITLRDQFDNLKDWISGAYYSSEIGMRELGWTGDVFFESFPGCNHPDGHS